MLSSIPSAGVAARARDENRRHTRFGRAGDDRPGGLAMALRTFPWRSNTRASSSGSPPKRLIT